MFQSFFASHPSVQQNKFFITGESYGMFFLVFFSRPEKECKNEKEKVNYKLTMRSPAGGHYIPALATAIVSLNAQAQLRGAPLFLPHLEGIAIGDGLTDPLTQVKLILSLSVGFLFSYGLS